MTNIEHVSIELRRMIDASLGADRVKETTVEWYRDHAGERAISLSVTMHAAKDIPDAKHRIALTHALVQTLERLEEHRFPYLYFDAPDEDSAPQDADDAEPLPAPTEQS